MKNEGIKIRYVLPNSGWFENYLQTIASSLTGGGNAKTDDGIRDVGEYCAASFHEIILASFRIFHFNRESITILKDVKEDSSGAGYFLFPEITTTWTYAAKNAAAKLTFYRMINGHMGYNEDNLDFYFSHPELEYRVSANIFSHEYLEIQILRGEAYIRQKPEKWFDDYFTKLPPPDGTQ